MSRSKNALRQHFIAPISKENPVEADFLRLAKWISTIADETEEQVDDVAYYDGDGTLETSVFGVKGGFSFEGTYDPTDAAQQFVADLKYKTGDARKVWHKIISADGTKQWLGAATVQDIIAGGGEAEEYEEFSCQIVFNEIPKETNV